jgi:hypothetical protein
MMINLFKKAIVLGLTAAVAFTAVPAQSVKAADVAPLHTSVSVDGKDAKQTVTYDLNLDQVYATDGRVAVTFDKDVLELTKTGENVNFDEKDLNKEFSEDGSEGVSFAFVNDKSKKRGGKVLHLKFSVKQDAQLKATETVIKTQVFGINNEDESVVAATVLEDAVTVGRNKPVTPQNVTAEQVVGGVRISWTKDDNADYYIVYRSKTVDGKYQKIGTSKNDSLLNAFVGFNDYYYKVVAYQAGTPSYYSEESAPVKITVTKLLGIIG